MLELPVWGWSGWLSLGMGFHLIVVQYGFSDGGFIYVLIMPLQKVTRLRQELTPPVKEQGGMLGWKNFKPIHSDHWGNPRSQELLPPWAD